MNARALIAPGVAFEAVRPPPEPSPLRSDVAAFVGPTRRGPIGEPVRVEGYREYRRVFGELDRGFDTPYAVRGYFENGGEVAWIVRLAARPLRASAAVWRPSALEGIAESPFEVTAASAGAWSRGARVTITYRARGGAGGPRLDLEVRTSDEREELRALPASAFTDAVAQASQLVRFVQLNPPAPELLPKRAFATYTVVLDAAGEAVAPAVEDYLTAIERLDDVPEVALLALPDVHRHLGAADAGAVLRAAAEHAEVLRDRLVIVDLPESESGLRWQVEDIDAWLDAPGRLGRGDHDRTGAVRFWRAAALYHPWVRVADPLGGVARPTRDIPACGHVAGVISRLDRERGAHATPANAPLLGVLDLRDEYGDDEHALLNEQGVDLLRCVPSLGFSIWGGRTLDREDRFVAHRRLVHRLVRAIRRVAEPLTFETNGPPLWFAFVRAITSVLLAAWRAGALAGGRPDEAFAVTCDESTNPPEEVELGRCLCLIEFAPAIPMEFIAIRVALSRDGTLEVLS